MSLRPDGERDDPHPSAQVTNALHRLPKGYSVSAVLRTIEEIENDLMTGAPRRRFIVPGVIPAGPIILYGGSGSGKTGIAILTSVILAAGLAWAGRPVSKGAVLFVGGEDYWNVEARLVAAARFYGVDTKDLPLAVVEPAAGGVTGSAFEAETIRHAEDLVKLTGQELAMVVVDTLGACFGDESQDDARPATKAMGVFDRISQRFQCAVIAVHHTGKSGEGMRGSQVFFDRADAVIHAEAIGGSTKLTVKKIKNAPGRPQFIFDIGSYDLGICDETISMQIVTNLRAIGPAIAGPAVTLEPKRKRKDHEHAYDVLCQISSSASVLIDTWKDALFREWMDKSASAKTTAFSSARVKLSRLGKIKEKGKFVSVLVSENSAENLLTTPASNADLSASASAPPSLKEGATLTKQPPSIEMTERVGIPRKSIRPVRTGTGG
ncbi:AAA family ATPase [Mesorhizobium sp. ES1-1]|uniref:AAA family ATPase n=1 Tax=Mesorhizobium sp. ES1-1 TaxID=2876629 RepID=UPI001CCC7B05|nr:AAA family ATPase [Mesorhizobium sp. ES1-1]MBZ9678232.1 AAA family ATPase [Mesorhizobium sp. ES1-1]